MHMTKKVESAENVLIVDDVIANLVVLTDMINDAGYIARPVTSVVQAQEAVKVMLPQLILLDISMPDMDGFEWCAKLKKDPATREIPIIFISALNSIEDKQKAYQLGAADFVCKPFDVYELALKISAHISNAKKLQDMNTYNQNLLKLLNEQTRLNHIQQEGFIDALIRIAKTDDSVRENHGKRIAVNARRIALALQFLEIENIPVTNEFVEYITKAAPLHEVGRNLCEHPKDCLTCDSDRSEVSPVICMAAVIAYCFHEKWDGSGEPNQLSGCQIPLEVRIVSAADAYDRWIGEEMAKMPPKLSQEEKLDASHAIVMDRINSESGKSFDPAVVMVMNKIQRQLKR